MKPTANQIAWRDSENALVLCPFCGMRHRHGDGDGWRVAHCNTADVPDVYYVKTRAMDATATRTNADAEIGQSFMVPSGRGTSEIRQLPTMDAKRLTTA